MPLPPDLLLALLFYAFVSSITPGPNNLMLLASGVNFGFRRTLPHMLGIGAGFTLMVALTGWGLAGLFAAWPPLHTLLTLASVAYLLWLAWKIAHAAPPSAREAAGRPLTFWQAAGFQWVNPKAWSMALTACTLYLPPGGSGSAVLAVALVFGAVNLPCVSSWAALGTGLRGWLADPVRLRAFNWTMAGLLIATLWPVIAA
jgi:Putative threonine efflux protein